MFLLASKRQVVHTDLPLGLISAVFIHAFWEGVGTSYSSWSARTLQQTRESIFRMKYKWQSGRYGIWCIANGKRGSSSSMSFASLKRGLAFCLFACFFIADYMLFLFLLMCYSGSVYTVWIAFLCVVCNTDCVAQNCADGNTRKNWDHSNTVVADVIAQFKSHSYQNTVVSHEAF